MGFLTDTTLCIGCKACEVACKQWNQLPMDNLGPHRLQLRQHRRPRRDDLAARRLRRAHRRRGGPAPDQPAAVPEQLADAQRRLQALRATPAAWRPAPPARSSAPSSTPSFIQQDVCNGCGYCLPACPFGVPELSDHRPPGAQVHALLRPPEGRPGACLREGLPHRLDPVRPGRRAAGAGAGARGASCGRAASRARTSTATRPMGGTGGIDGLNALFILTAPPEVYNLPSQPGAAPAQGAAGLPLDRGHGRRARRGGGRCGASMTGLPCVALQPGQARVPTADRVPRRADAAPTGAAEPRRGRRATRDELLRRAGDPQAALAVADHHLLLPRAASRAAATPSPASPSCSAARSGRRITRAWPVRLAGGAAALPAPADPGPRPTRALPQHAARRSSCARRCRSAPGGSRRFGGLLRPVGARRGRPRRAAGRAHGARRDSAARVPSRAGRRGGHRCPRSSSAGTRACCSPPPPCRCGRGATCCSGPLFLASALSSATAAIALVLAAARGTSRETLARLERLDA